MGNKQISTEGVNMRFQDKIAIVTGGASGIGKEVATRFVAEGGSVVINDRDRAKAEAAARQIDPGGKRAVVHVGNIASPATGEAAVKTAIDKFGRLDVLFNSSMKYRRSLRLLPSGRRRIPDYCASLVL
jgi:NAD(P)-dependent dehydrogenase (short-subunit alcohol dehydrogenase family)